MTHAARTEWMRQVNLVRKQEFAYLRSVQKRQTGEVTEPTLAGLPARLPREGKVRGDTLKKIDEIEAQLDLLWVASRSKRAESVVAASTGPSDAGTPTQFSTSFLASPGVLTQMMHHSEMPASVLLVPSLDDQTEQPTLVAVPQAPAEHSAVAPGLQPLPTDAVPSDDVLTKAAALFAEAEYELAAQHLARSLRGSEGRSDLARRRLLALLDIYRATGNQAQFDWSVLEYFDFWDGHTPQWKGVYTAAVESPDLRHSAIKPLRADSAEPSHGTRLWRCPSILSRSAADELQAHWTQGGHCTIDWTSLSAINADAAARLLAVFHPAQASPEQLVFVDTPNLLYVLEQATPIGTSEVDRSLWLLRFCMLGMMGMRAAFDTACTDFCLTYIEPAPVWQPGTIQFVVDTLAAPPVAPTATGKSPWFLHGHVLGETGLGLPDPLPGRMNVDCTTLVRMDASATALLLQWLRQANSQGSEVHFSDVGLLIDAFWSTAGVGAFARLHLRDVN
ncbi:MAG: hypothetical protein ACKOWD_17110 [Rhodoferax sp.]